MASIINSTDTGSGGLITTGDSSDELQLQTAETTRVTLTNTAVVVNEDGNDVDFRVEGDTDANLLFVDAGNDKVGIGTSSPNGKLDIVSSSAGANTNTLFLTNSSGTANTATSLIFGVGSDPTIRNATIRAINDGSNNISLAFLTSAADAPAERIRVTQNGITFNGDTAAANALDDYEEGTFTPTVTSGVTSPTYTTQLGKYTKVGNLVTISFGINLSGGTASASQIVFSGLPFTNNATNPMGCYVIYNQSFNTNAGDSYYIQTNASTIAVYTNAGNGRNGNDAGVSILNALYIVGSYLV